MLENIAVALLYFLMVLIVIGMVYRFVEMFVEIYNMIHKTNYDIDILISDAVEKVRRAI